MIRPRIRALVSLAVAMTVTLALGACVRAPSRPAVVGPAPIENATLAIRFENDARERVHVYLIGERREWLLGRVEPGAVATLRFPEESLAENSGFVQLAVLMGERVTLQAGRDPRATFTVAQPASEILSQRWMFAQGQLKSLSQLRN